MRIGNFEDNRLELTPNARCDVDLSPHRSSQIAEFFLSRDFSDVQFEIDGERIPAHRCILASSCDYFQVLFYGGMREQFEEVVRLQDVSLSAFKAILRYIYTGKLALHHCGEDLLDILGLAHQYHLKNLQGEIADFLECQIVPDNACKIFEASRLYGLTSIVEACRTAIKNAAFEVFQSKDIIGLSIESLNLLLVDEIRQNMDEIDVFRAIARWIEANPGFDRGPLLANIDLTRISSTNLLDFVRRSNLFENSAIADAAQRQLNGENVDGHINACDASFRRHHPSSSIAPSSDELKEYPTPYNKDLASVCRGARVKTTDQGIFIALSKIFIVNNLQMILTKGSNYTFEVSADAQIWTMVFDHSDIYCHSKQNLFFHPQPVRYVRLLFNCSLINASNIQVQLSSENVQLCTRSGYQTDSVVRCGSKGGGVRESCDEIFAEDNSNGTFPNSSSICFYLPHPYVVGSLRMCLSEEHEFSCFIEGCLDSGRTLVIHNKTERCRGSQVMVFDPIPLRSISITPTYSSTPGGTFSLLNFECPAS